MEHEDQFSFQNCVNMIELSLTTEELTKVVASISEAYGYLPPSTCWREAAAETDSPTFRELLTLAAEQWEALVKEQG